jgi:hypothetical protein
VRVLRFLFVILTFFSFGYGGTVLLQALRPGEGLDGTVLGLLACVIGIGVYGTWATSRSRIAGATPDEGVGLEGGRVRRAGAWVSRIVGGALVIVGVFVILATIRGLDRAGILLSLVSLGISTLTTFLGASMYRDSARSSQHAPR